MASTLRLQIVTPETVTVSEATLVTLPCVEGQIGVYPMHVPLVTALAPGEIIVEHEGRTRSLAVGIGLVDVTGTEVSVLTDFAVDADKLDEAKVEEARQRAAARLSEKIADEEIASVNASLARALSQLQFKRRKRT